MVIRGLGSVAMQPAAGKPGVGRPGFNIGAGPPATPSQISGTAALDGLLLLQEATAAPTRDRRARRHGRALLDALARLQLSLLGGEPGQPDLHNLADLATNCPEASDPALKEALDAIVLRARVELARREL